MIGTALIMGAAVIVGASVLATFWKKIVDWLKRIYKKLESLVKGLLYGTRVFFKKMGEAVAEITKNYSKVGTKWQETIVDRKASLSDIPEEYQNKLSENIEQEFTEELENHLVN